jgi:hypothetical protein
MDSSFVFLRYENRFRHILAGSFSWKESWHEKIGAEPFHRRGNLGLPGLLIDVIATNPLGLWELLTVLPRNCCRQESIATIPCTGNGRVSQILL